ncbi:aminotransferase class V-fold PLP-dependent enzyme [Rhizobiales bacterium]|uniref:aminotransferase class V-fold PLP-dependent enzyme n=1 Tax=Hongsoonwoonella zoysiae TaxID=2821844 RepID=UPI0015616FE3|nr:aminotransferase class V-fold PLP-dependent enzyme [Hongsoonwoonella zoysiae]NRG16994.1 aminotransferase class V-fold PLP-dependent enzyme [Hongsoonwoonella zoysiae]
MTLSENDVERLRADTPGVENVTHFNHSSCSLPSNQVLREVVGHLYREAASGPSEVGILAAADVQATRDAAAQLLNASPGEIALTGSGSQGWGAAFAALPRLKPGDRLLTSRHEWGGNLSMMRRAAERSGATVEFIPCRTDGTVSPEALANMIDERVKLVALTWLPANGGLINPAAELGRITRAAGVPYFVDAGQALGQLETDVNAIGCDVLKGAGRKFLRGPRGTAILYVRDSFLRSLDPMTCDVLSAPWLDGGPRLREDARRFETSENSFALQLGLGEAIRQALEIGIANIRDRIETLSQKLRAELSEMAGIAPLDLGTEKSGIVSFSIPGMPAAEVRGHLARNNINVAAIAAAYCPVDMAERGLSEVVRASVSYLTTESEIDRLTDALRQLRATRSRDLAPQSQ